MHGQHCEDSKQKRHMWCEPSGVHGTEADSARLKSFSKGGRKIAVGATALFQAGDALPFIGIIRKVIAEKESAVKLCVNWLYRPGDIELAKGLSLEVAPNEIFYSFHKDEISAASLLHPCKVAFLPKGVELPSTVSHFICRRVYDTSNKCLYWLTDQDYTDEHQGEVNRLLNKTKHEMQAGAHSERPSQRALSELAIPKRETVNVAPTSQGKSKKRERTDQTLDSSRREKLTKVEELEVKRESTMKYEDFAAIAHKKGGITSMPSVDQLVRVMSEECNDTSKKLVDVVPHRTLLAGIVAATEREECLAQFVRLGALPMLDGWLQEAHKGKPAEGDKGLEELLLVLLRALERLPVDLDALKTCNVGKSVNNLKSHKNPEVQKKARKLVSTWKKRVDAEMNSIDEAKSGLNSATTWSCRPSIETPISKGGFVGGSKITNGTGPSGDTTSVSAYKDLPETFSSKDNPAKALLCGISEVPTVVKEEKSCSSSQSQNNSQSLCSGSTKGAGSWKEEGKGLSVVSGVNKSGGTALRGHTKTHPAASSLGFQRDLAGRNKTSGLERMGSGAFTDKKTSEVVRAENHNSQRLIVRLPNPGRSPAHSTSGGGLIEGSASTNRGSSPNVIDKHDSLNGSSRGPDIHSPETSGDTKCGNSAAKFAPDCKEETNRSCIATKDGDVPCKSSADIKQRPKSHLTIQPTPPTHLGTVKKGCNALPTTIPPASSIKNPASFDHDTAKGGIDLLASIAVCEGAASQKSFLESTGGEGPPCATEDNKDSAGHERVVNGPEPNSKDIEGDEQKKDGELECGLEQAVATVREFDPPPKDMELMDSLKDLSSTSICEKEQQGPAATSSSKVRLAGASELEMKASSPSVPETTLGSKLECESAYKTAPSVCIPDSLTDTGGDASTTGGLDIDDSLQEGAEDGTKVHWSPGTPTKGPSSRGNSEDLGTGFYEEDALEVARLVAMEVEQEVQRYGLPEIQEACSLSPEKRSPSLEKAVADSPTKCKCTISPDAASTSMKDVSAEGSATNAALTDTNVGSFRKGKKDTGGEVLSGSLTLVKDDTKSRADLEPAEDSIGAAKEVHQVVAHHQSLIAGVSGTGEASVTDKEDLLHKDRSYGNTNDVVERPVFDLNEGLEADEGPHDRASGLSTMAAPLPDRTSCFPAHASSLAAPVAVVSAMKGAFIPPANISRPKGELGWKGSAATSAFRPAEPRRVAEALQSPCAEAAPTSGSIGTTSDRNGKQARFLDIDLNVADERMMEDSVMASTQEADVVSNGPAASRPALDLNRADESDESTVLPESNGRSSLAASRPMLDFDLNDGLGSEDAGIDEVSSSRDHKSLVVPPVFAEARPTAEFVNVLPWYTSTSSVPPAMVIPAFAGARPDLPYSVLAASSAKSVIGANHNFNQFVGNTYRPAGPMSSASVPYTAAAIPTGFSHAGFPFGAGYPFSSSSSYNINSVSNAALTNTPPFPAATPSQLLSAGAAVPSFGRPYLGSYIGEASQADPGVSWVKSGLDLNAGPEVIADSDCAREEGYGVRSTGSGHGQLSYQQVGALSGTLKRKEPEGGFGSFRTNFKQMAWREL